MKSILSMGAFALLAIAASQQGAAATHAFYIGAGAGQLKVPGDGNTTAYQGFFGADVGRYFGIEAGYIGVRDVSTGFYDPSMNMVSYGDVSMRSAQLSLLGRIPISRYFSLFGRAGGLYWREGVTYGAYDFQGGFASYSDTVTGTAFEWGAGAEASFGHFGIRAEFEQARIQAVNDQLITGSVLYRF